MALAGRPATCEWLVALLAALLWILPSVTRAEPPSEPEPSFGVEWLAPNGCGTADEVLRKVHAVLGPQPLASSGAEGSVRVHGEVVRAESGFRLTLQIDDGHDEVERTLTDGGCVGLVEAAVAIVAVAVGPSGGPAPVRSARPPVVGPEPAPTPSVKKKPWGVFARAEGAVDLDVTSATVGGAGLQFGLQHGRFRVLASGHLSVPSWVIPSGRVESEGARVRLAAGGAAACLVPRSRRFPSIAFPLCGGIMGGVMRASAERLRNPSELRRPWAALTGSGAVALPIARRVSFVAGVRTFVPLLRPIFRVRSQGDMVEILRTPAVGLRMFAGLELHT